jgi:hypothetical protein
MAQLATIAVTLLGAGRVMGIMGVMAVTAEGMGQIITVEVVGRTIMAMGQITTVMEMATTIVTAAVAAPARPVQSRVAL